MRILIKTATATTIELNAIREYDREYSKQLCQVSIHRGTSPTIHWKPSNCPTMHIPNVGGERNTAMGLQRCLGTAQEYFMVIVKFRNVLVDFSALTGFTFCHRHAPARADVEDVAYNLLALKVTLGLRCLIACAFSSTSSGVTELQTSLVHTFSGDLSFGEKGDLLLLLRSFRR